MDHILYLGECTNVNARVSIIKWPDMIVSIKKKYSMLTILQDVLFYLSLLHLSRKASNENILDVLCQKSIVQHLISLLCDPH